MSDKLKILVVPANDGGCSYYRAWLPIGKLAQHFPDHIEIKFNKNPLGLDEKTGKWEEDWDFEDMKWCDVLVTQNIANFGGPYTARIIGKAKEFGKFVHYDTDDLLTNLYDGHRLKAVYEDKGLSEITKFFYNNSDLVTVTQTKFAHRVKNYCTGVLAIVKNAIDYTLPCWNYPKVPPPRKRYVRVGWAGGIHHEEDVKEFAGVPHFVNQRVGPNNVKWDFYGRPPEGKDGKEDWQHEVWANYKSILLRGLKGANNFQIHGAMPSDQYGVMYAHMDIAIAPLQMNDFNDSKSEIKVAECGRYGVPLVASNVGCYDETIINGKTGYLIDPGAPPSEWVKVLTKVIRDKKHRDQMGQNLKEITDEYFDINNVIDKRLLLYKECFIKLGYDELLNKIKDVV